MEYVERMMEAVRYIEKRLGQKTNVDEIAGHIGYSKFHFQRLFHQVTNHTVGQYVAARKLTEAAKTLRRTNYRIIDVSYMYGFESHETFTRAFKARFGVLPNEWRGSGRIPPNLMMDVLKAEYLDHIQQLEAEAAGQVVLDEKIVRGYSARSGSVEHIYDCWNRLWKNCRNKQTDKFGIVRYDDSMEFDATYTYLAAAEAEHIEAAEEQEPFTIPEGTYIVFEHRGSVEKLPLTYRYIYGTWFTRNTHRLNGVFDFEYYGERFVEVDRTDSGILIYVPVSG
ncbi:HTH-type transcriptional activator RhaR [Paenibacillus sp. CECT 9249]|uniref:AraC family transcriptional regulator n=1 Tax=Paenibacillus sp. CECT 9249 TaxID=2845385 RepID=UPI001E5E7831|nr:helix-turn-helix domain-containing protein [Paenibacillus sp. CECT 9249]CAH0121431.1 HTH-type transcriptional activator RhaR [Paenibacillus sp. CECT 9249]